MLKNLFTFLIGCLAGIVVMGVIVFVLQAQARMDLMPIIMLVCILILAAIALIAYYINKRRIQNRRR